MYLMKYRGKVRGGRVELGALAREPMVADELNTVSIHVYSGHSSSILKET